MAGDDYPRNVRPVTFSLSERDLGLLEQIAEFYNSTKSDALRTAIRHLAASNGMLKGK